MNCRQKYLKLFIPSYSSSQTSGSFKRPPIESYQTDSTETPIDKNKDNKILTTNTKKTVKDHKKYRLNTKGCKINELPLYDEETKDIFKETNKTKTIWDCIDTVIKFERFNETWIRLSYYVLDDRPLCYYRSLKVGPKGDKSDFKYGR